MSGAGSVNVLADVPVCVRNKTGEPIKLKQNFKIKVYETQKTLEQKTNMDQTGTDRLI